MRKMFVALMLAITMLISSASVFAFGLGEIKINSVLNQAMDADIELTGINPAQVDEVQVEVASQRVFERFGVPRPYILTRLKFTPMLVHGKPVIRVTSTDAIREPFLTFLLDVRWANGKLLREYTVLLDPPVFGDKAKAAIMAPKVTSHVPSQAPTAKKPAPKSSNIATAPAPRTPAPSVRPKQAAVPSTASKPVTTKKTKPQSGTQPVRRGDTLWAIAAPYAREQGVSVNQMMLAIQSANPNGFSKNNINNLKSGVVLRIPAADARNFSAKEAQAEVQRQWQVWKQGPQAADSAVNADVSHVSDQGASSTQTEQAASDADASLSILGEGDAVDGKSGDDARAKLSQMRQQVALLKESAQSKGQENSDLKGRIESLESMIKKQEDIISLQNEQLAQLQNSSQPDDAETALADAAEIAEETMEDAGSEAAEEMVADAQQEVMDGATQEIKPATVEPLPDFSEPIPEEFLQAEQKAAESAEGSLLAEAEVSEEVMPAEIETPASEVAEPSMVDGIISAIKDKAMYIIAGVVALLLVLFGLKRRNRDPEAEIEASGLPAFAEEPSVDKLDDEDIASPDSVDEALDSLETVEEETAEAAPAVHSEDEADSDDVLAEADVYISYGLYQQAEELLVEGLAKNPANSKYQLKLAEIYHGDKKSNEFVQHIESIAPNFDKQSSEWSKIATMGAALAPTHALFAGESAASEVVEAATSDVAIDSSDADKIEDFAVAEENLEEFDAEELDDNSLDFAFEDDSASLSELEAAATAQISADALTDDELADDVLEESSTAILEDALEVGAKEDDATQIFNVETGSVETDGVDDATEAFLDFDADQLEGELNSVLDDEDEQVSAGDTEMLNDPFADESDQDSAIDLGTELSNTASGIAIDNDLDEILDGDSSETAMFDSSLFDVDSPEAKAFAGGEDERVDEDAVSLEQVQENLTAELETLSFDSDDIDPDNLEEGGLPTLQTEEMGKPDLDVDELNDSLAASETGTFEKDMVADIVTEQFDMDDVGDLDASMTDLGEFGDDDYEMENPSVIEEVGTKLDLAKAFVDMGDEDAAKETLTEVMEQGDQTQIQEAKNILDKLN